MAPPAQPPAPARRVLRSYATVAGLVAAAPAAATADPALVLSQLEAASDALDAAAGRTFQPYLAARYFTAGAFEDDSWAGRAPDRWPYALGGGGAMALDYRPVSIYVPDLLAVTELATDDADNGAYATVWAATDYELLPYDAPDERGPFTRIAVATGGAHAFPRGRGCIRVTGTWGYWYETVALGALVQTAMDAVQTTLSINGTAPSPGHTLLIDSEQLYVTAVPPQPGQPVTVARAANGTTAAAHAQDAPIYRFAYPRAVNLATLRQASVTAGYATTAPLKRETVGDITLEYDTAAAAAGGGEARAAGPIPLGVPTRRRFFA